MGPGRLGYCAASEPRFLVALLICDQYHLSGSRVLSIRLPPSSHTPFWKHREDPSWLRRHMLYRVLLMGGLVVLLDRGGP